MNLLNWQQDNVHSKTKKLKKRVTPSKADQVEGYTSDSHEPAEEEDQEWNADRSLCVIGHFAVVQSLYIDVYGMSVVKVHTYLLFFFVNVMS